MSKRSAIFCPMGESVEHRELKEMGMAWLREQGCTAVATEIRLPFSSYRVDVAGYRASPRIGASAGITFALECKQSRADFLKDSGIEDEAKREFQLVSQRSRTLRELLSTHLNVCRVGESLFAEYDTYDFANWRHDTWNRVSKQLQQLENRISGGVKFSRIARFACASYCFVLTDAGVVRTESELPAGWGWLERYDSELRIKRAGLKLDSRPEARLKLLERIASRLSR